MRKIFATIFAVFACSSLLAEHVVIVGGGPAGLATAIEAHQNGAEVTLIEKRKEYSREQTLFIFNSSIDLLEKWQVTVPWMRVVDKGPGTKLGFVQIKILEEAMDARVKELGVTKLYGEFKRIEHGKLVIAEEGEEREISYDLLVGADGVHSPVRESLGIPVNCMGKAYAVAVGVILANPSKFEITPDIRKDDLFGKKFSLPFASLVCVQSVKPLEKLETMLMRFGWEKEAEAISKGQAEVFDNIEVILQQAETFSDKRKSAILVGEATAAASFFHGMGANTAFKTAALAGEFFQALKNDPGAAFDAFNNSVKVTTDAMIEDSRNLFPKECSS